MPRLRNANACCRAVQQGLEWLGPHFGNDEEWAARPHALVAYHKVPYLLASTGHVEECRRALAWINTNLVTPEGDFNSTPAPTDEAFEPAQARYKAWIILAAQISSCYDIATPGVRFLAGQQGASTGGIYDLDTNRQRSESADVRTTASAGLAFLSCGMTEAAHKCGRFLTCALQTQSDENRFYIRLDARGILIRKFPKSQTDSHVVMRARGKTRVGFLGIPMVFLAKLHLATREDQWLESAMDYFAFAQQYDESAWTGERSGPLGWGAAALYGITRRRLYYDAADRVAQAWIRRQRPNGSWRPQGGDPDSSVALTRTAETAICLLESLREAQ